MTTAEQIRSQLASLRGLNTIVLGIGNTLKGDDGAGALLCELLVGKTCAEPIDAGTVPENYIQKIIKKTPQLLLVADAIDFGEEPGTLKLFTPDRLDSLVISTHTLSPRVFVDMICAEIDVQVYFIAVQPAQLGLGRQISDKVNNSVKELAEILAETFPAQ